MKISIFTIYGQIYLTPFLKVTHTRTLNCDIEILVGWLKWEISVGW